MARLPDFTVSQQEHNMNVLRVVNVPVLDVRAFKHLYFHLTAWERCVKCILNKPLFKTFQSFMTICNYYF